MSARDLRSMEEARFRTKAENISTKLRSIADEIDREMKSSRNMVRAPEFGWRAQQIVHSVMWGLANADLAGLVLLASEVDASGESGSETE